MPERQTRSSKICLIAFFAVLVMVLGVFLYLSVAGNNSNGTNDLKKSPQSRLQAPRLTVSPVVELA